MHGRDTPPTPLERGDWDTAFFLVVSRLSGDDSPLERGFKGCVTVRGAAWVEGLRDTVSRNLVLRGGICRLWVAAFDLRWQCLDVTHPRPLSRGEV